MRNAKFIAIKNGAVRLNMAKIGNFSTDKKGAKHASTSSKATNRLSTKIILSNSDKRFINPNVL